MSDRLDVAVLRAKVEASKTLPFGTVERFLADVHLERAAVDSLPALLDVYEAATKYVDSDGVNEAPLFGLLGPTT